MSSWIKHILSGASPIKHCGFVGLTVEYVSFWVTYSRTCPLPEVYGPIGQRQDKTGGASTASARQGYVAQAGAATR